jgi:uncharacterized protein YciI
MAVKRSKQTDGPPSRHVAKARAREKAAADLRLRTSGHNCPLCLHALPRIAGSRVARSCGACGARAVGGKRCAECLREAIWESAARAACQACGHTGSRVMVVAGDLGRNVDAEKPQLFAVLRQRGAGWNGARSLEQQREWSEHAAFMDGLEAEGFALLAGPLQDTGDALLIVRARDEQEVHARLAEDPWTRSGLLRTSRCAAWTLRLGSLAARDE